MKISEYTESCELLLELWIIAVGVLEILVNEVVLHNKLVREGLAESKNSSLARVWHL